MELAPNVLSEASEIGFELDRFDLEDGRLELAGRWFGVQGRRFIRPSLTLRADEGEIRLLADLAHKPWAAEHGELWRAAFPCDGQLDADSDAELTVAPDVTVELRVPDAARARRGRKRDASRSRREHARTEQGRALSSARAEIATLREQLETISEELERERTRPADELREAQQAAADAVRRRDDAVAARRKEREAREIAQETIERALAARHEAKTAAEQALAERDEMMVRLQEAIGRRREAVAERDQVLAQRDQAVAEREQLRHQREAEAASRAPTPVISAAAVNPQIEWRRAPRLAAAIALTSLLAVTLAVILILSSH